MGFQSSTATFGAKPRRKNPIPTTRARSIARNANAIPPATRNERPSARRLSKSAAERPFIRAFAWPARFQHPLEHRGSARRQVLEKLEHAELDGRTVMRRVRAPQDLVAVSDVPVVRLGDHLRVRVLRLPVERARGDRDVEEHLAAVHQRMIVAERGKAELAGCFHGELSYPERQR